MCLGAQFKSPLLSLEAFSLVLQRVFFSVFLLCACVFSPSINAFFQLLILSVLEIPLQLSVLFQIFPAF